jgi:flagellar hook-associated protein 1 FlgK
MLTLDSALWIASSGVANINNQLALVSHNVANAGTASYSVETGTQQALTADGTGMGVVTGAATRVTDAALQSDLLQQNATVAGLQTTQTALSAIDTVSGTPGDGNDLGSLLNNLQNQFSTLLNDPDNATQQSEVVATATTLTQSINTLGNTYTTQRQQAQDSIVSEVTQVNTTLGTIGSLSDQIMAAQAAGQSTADLENQRDAQLSSLSQLVNINVLSQSNGDVLITTTSGTELPIHGNSDPLSTSDTNVEPGDYYPGGGIPAITLGGADITDSLQGGQLGANITLRDTTLPSYQGQLDEFSETLAQRFSAQGLTLFTDASGNVPASGGTPVQSGYVGFSADIQVNPSVQSDPSLVRDGTNAITGNADGASAFTPNPTDGPSGFTTLITRVLDNTFGADVQTGVAQPSPNVTGLGPSGTLSASYVAPPTLSSFATALVSAEATDSDNASTQLTTEQTVQSGLSSRLSSETGVNMDAEMTQMITLQNAYNANAKVMSTVQSMFSALLQAVTV